MSHTQLMSHYDSACFVKICKVFENRLYLSGGTRKYYHKETDSLHHVWNYCPEDKKWKLVGLMKNNRIKHVMNTYQNNIIVVGGIKGNFYIFRRN